MEPTYGNPGFLHLYNSLPLSANHSSQTDEELLLRFRSTGDNVWLGVLLQRYTLLLLGVAMKYLKDKDAAQDAVQQIFLKSLTHLPEGEIGNFKGWLYVLMRNHCLQKLRDQKYFAAEEVLDRIPADADALEALRQHELTLIELQEALKQLSPEQRSCVDSFYLQRKSYQGIM